MHYTEEQKRAAIKAYIVNGKNAAKTVMNLGVRYSKEIINRI